MNNKTHDKYLETLSAVASIVGELYAMSPTREEATQIINAVLRTMRDSNHSVFGEPRAQYLKDFVLSKITVNAGGCWEWTGIKTPNGYGQLRFNGATVSAHRFSHVAYKGKIPDGLHIDHLCKNRLRVNPEHLEDVTQLENWKRGDAAKTLARISKARSQKLLCVQGHKLAGENLRIKGDGSRVCRKCAIDRAARQYRKNKGILNV